MEKGGTGLETREDLLPKRRKGDADPFPGLSEASLLCFHIHTVLRPAAASLEGGVDKNSVAAIVAEIKLLTGQKSPNLIPLGCHSPGWTVLVFRDCIHIPVVKSGFG